MSLRPSGHFFFFQVSFVIESPKERNTKENTKSIEVCPESVGAMLAYCMIYRTWPIESQKRAANTKLRLLFARKTRQGVLPE